VPPYHWSDALVPAPPLAVPGARARIRAANQADGRRLLVIDDDPTGSQAVHHVDAVLSLDPAVIGRSLAAPGSVCFVLTNSRSLAEPEAYGLSLRLGELAAALERGHSGRVEVISRSDSTLRGHLRAEVAALCEARRVAGRPGYDGVLLAPAYFEAGRFTAGDVHWARVNGQPVAAGETEFARDASFGYAASELPAFVAEKHPGELRAADVRALSLADIRRGGPDRVAGVLLALPPQAGTFVAVNAVDYADLDVVTLGVQQAEAAGRSFLFRSGPSLVQSLAGQDPVPPLATVPTSPGRHGHGLVVAGSHTGLTTRQIQHLLAGGGVTPVVLDAGMLLGPGAQAEVAATAGRVRDALSGSDVLLMTSREVLTGAGATASLDIARTVSASLVAVTGQVVSASLPWILTKGGITSHDILATALGVRRAEVLGQLFAGFVSVLRPVDARPEATGLPCVVFAGNVGDETSLRAAVTVLRGRAAV
jgi:uncharacterized protein YgbK (DUF1537 family)